jgi:hypothetical protein
MARVMIPALNRQIGICKAYMSKKEKKSICASTGSKVMAYDKNWLLFLYVFIYTGTRKK